MTEIQLFQRLMKHIGLVVLLEVLIGILLNYAGPKELVEPFNGIVYSDESSSNRVYYADRMEAFVKDSDILKVELFDKNQYVYSRIQGLSKGKTWVEYRLKDTGEIILHADYIVLRNHTVINKHDDNFSNWMHLRFLVLAIMLLFTLTLWESFFFALKKARYSYLAIFCCGFGIWMLVADITQANFILNRDDMMRSLYAVLQKAPIDFLNYSIPFVLVFAVSMSVSNVSLIRHEGFRLTNILGIGISAAMILSSAGFMSVYSSFSPNSIMENKIFTVSCSVYASLYCLLECFLFGSMVCGAIAAKHEPDYDKDFLVILGCGVKKDGTLYPLLRGRVDRAIQFQKTQLEKTGRKAVFVPSGGKGEDEPISEAEAMKRYLLEQGYSEEDVLIENRSANTAQNMAFSKKLIEPLSREANTAFATTNYHVFRSGILARQQEFYADGMGSETRWYFWPNAAVREMIGMVTYCRRSLLLNYLFISAFFSVLVFA